MRTLALAPVLLPACGGAHSGGSIDAIVEPRARVLERNAETLCLKLKLQGLDRIDDVLEYRHQGEPLELLRVRAGKCAAAAG